MRQKAIEDHGREVQRRLYEPSTGVDVVIALILAVVIFNVVYVLGQLLNGVAAVVLDRVIVKKLLQYPFALCELKSQNTDESRRTSTCSARPCSRLPMVCSV
jgi:hypothetical protein